MGSQGDSQTSEGEEETMNDWIPYQDDWTCWGGDCGFPTKEMAIESGKVLFKGKPFKVARKTDFEFNQCDIERILEDADREVQDHHGEFSSSWRQKISAATEHELREWISKTLHRWALTNGLYPYNITDIEEVTP